MHGMKRYPICLMTNINNEGGGYMIIEFKKTKDDVAIEYKPSDYEGGELIGGKTKEEIIEDAYIIAEVLADMIKEIASCKNQNKGVIYMKTEKGYKMFRMKDGKLFPLYVLANKETEMNKWLEAEDGKMVNGKVRSRLGLLAYRPGWHIAEIPNSPWIGKKTKGGELVRRKNCVWCEVEYPTDVCYKDEAFENGWKRCLRGMKWSANRAYLKHIPWGGYYRFRTNTNGDEWIIAGKVKVNKVLSDDEVRSICVASGVVPQGVELAV